MRSRLRELAGELTRQYVVTGPDGSTVYKGIDQHKHNAGYMLLVGEVIFFADLGDLELAVQETYRYAVDEWGWEGVSVHVTLL